MGDDDSLSTLWSQRVTAGEYLCTFRKRSHGALCTFDTFDKKAQHLPFKLFGICFTRRKFLFYKEKMWLNIYLHNVSSEIVTNTRIHKEQIYTGGF